MAGNALRHGLLVVGDTYHSGSARFSISIVCTPWLDRGFHRLGGSCRLADHQAQVVILGRFRKAVESGTSVRIRLHFLQACGDRNFIVRQRCQEKY